MRLFFLFIYIQLFLISAVHSQQSIIDDIRTLIQAGKLAEADNLTNRYLTEDPTNVDALMMKGNVILNQYLLEQRAQLSIRPRFDESVYAMNVVELGPQPITVSSGVATRVAKLWKAAAILAPERQDLQLGVCQIYAISGMKEELLEQLPVVKAHADTLESLPADMSIYARNLEERGDIDGAIAVYKKISELFPAQKGLLSDIGGSYYFAGQPDSAKHYLLRSIEGEIVDETILGNAFFLGSLMGEYDMALEAIRRLPGNGDLLYEGVLKYYRNERKWEKPLKKFLDERPDSADAEVAELLLADDFRLDLDHYMTLMEHDIGDATKILLHLKFMETGEFIPAFNAAETYCFHKRYEAASAIFKQIDNRQQALDSTDRENLLFYHAWALLQLDQKEKALEKWIQLLDSTDFYKQSAAHWFAGKYYFDKGEKTKAREYFSKMAGDANRSKFATMCWHFMGE